MSTENLPNAYGHSQTSFQSAPVLIEKSINNKRKYLVRFSHYSSKIPSVNSIVVEPIKSNRQCYRISSNLTTKRPCHPNNTCPHQIGPLGLSHRKRHTIKFSSQLATERSLSVIFSTVILVLFLILSSDNRQFGAINRITCSVNNSTDHHYNQSTLNRHVHVINQPSNNESSQNNKSLLLPIVIKDNRYRRQLLRTRPAFDPMLPVNVTASTSMEQAYLPCRVFDLNEQTVSYATLFLVALTTNK